VDVVRFGEDLFSRGERDPDLLFMGDLLPLGDFDPVLTGDFDERLLTPRGDLDPPPLLPDRDLDLDRDFDPWYSLMMVI